jgi:hypothetical protein
VDYVNTLTHEAHKLLFAVLDEQNQIPPDVADDIREWNKQRYGFGWGDGYGLQHGSSMFIATRTTPKAGLTR